MTDNTPHGEERDAETPEESAPGEQWFGGDFLAAAAPPPPPYAHYPYTPGPSEGDRRDAGPPPAEEGPFQPRGEHRDGGSPPERPSAAADDIPDPEPLPPLEEEAPDPGRDLPSPPEEPVAGFPPPTGRPVPGEPPQGSPTASPPAESAPSADGEAPPPPQPGHTAADPTTLWPEREDGTSAFPAVPPTPGTSPTPPAWSGNTPPGTASAEELRPETLVRGTRRPPTGGWRRLVHSATFGMVHPGESPVELRRRELVARAKTHVVGGHHRLAVLSLKGGVGKTTTTVTLGSTLASLRGDRVLAVDANPDRGTLSDKVHLETAATIRDLLNERELIRRYADVRAFTSQTSSRLEVLASDRDPAISEAFSETDYRSVAGLLEHFYTVCLTDCGTGLLHSAMRGVLGLADQIVLVSSPSVDGARSASATLDWLEAHEYGYLVRGAVVVVSMVRANSKSTVDLDRLEQHFASRCRSVVRIPWDAHLEEGAEIDLERMAPETRHAYLELAALVGEAFAWPR